MAASTESIYATVADVWRGVAFPPREIQGLEAIANNTHGLFGRIAVRRKSAGRIAWDDAIEWLEAREAARAEWPWPER